MMFESQIIGIIADHNIHDIKSPSGQRGFLLLTSQVNLTLFYFQNRTFDPIILYPP